MRCQIAVSAAIGRSCRGCRRQWVELRSAASRRSVELRSRSVELRSRSDRGRHRPVTSGRDEEASSADRRASARDQAASNHDLAASAGPSERCSAFTMSLRPSASRATSNVTTSSLARARTSAERFETAPQRDETARLRDLAAEARDRAAAERDRAEELAAQLTNRPPGYAVQLRAAAAVRARAALDRAQAARDREQAARDREEAARDREQVRHRARAAHLDDLTGTYRRTMRRRRATARVDRARRSARSWTLGSSTSMALKRINDREGHAAGDALLRDVATDAIRSKLRSYDPIVRFGGDEFVCALSDTTSDRPGSDSRRSGASWPRATQADRSASGLRTCAPRTRSTSCWRGATRPSYEAEGRRLIRQPRAV